ncbi:TRADD-N-associated membrane domain-containing protein [Pseudomonas sp. LB3P38]|uniref:TRADD-N-associated membrane domain-containing protein n=1 Tax=Pseudomonas lyxosi TaxID=3398358 RepID=UPI0039EDF0C6
MFPFPFGNFVELLYRAWFKHQAYTRPIIIVSFVFAFMAFIVVGLLEPAYLEQRIAEPIAAIFAVIALLLSSGVIAYQSYIEQEEKNTKIEQVEKRVREHPEKPQLAWDLARSKLENYLDRNLSQVKSIFWLTLLVMLVGFGFILYGLYHAFESPDKLPVSIVASASGVLVSLIGGSFLIIYRSILAQSTEYVSVLERINAVGMAVQVISNISNESASLREETTAELAKQLIGLYAAPKK